MLSSSTWWWGRRLPKLRDQSGSWVRCSTRASDLLHSDKATCVKIWPTTMAFSIECCRSRLVCWICSRRMNCFGEYTSSIRWSKTFLLSLWAWMNCRDKRLLILVHAHHQKLNKRQRKNWPKFNKSRRSKASMRISCPQSKMSHMKNYNKNHWRNLWRNLRRSHRRNHMKKHLKRRHQPQPWSQHRLKSLK